MDEQLTGRGSPHYGKLMTASLPSEVKNIWYSRNDELPELQPNGWSWEQQVEHDFSSIELVQKIIAATPLTPRESTAIYLHIIEGYTLDEIGKIIDRSRDRVRQIISCGLRRLRTHQETVTGIKPYMDSAQRRWREMLNC
jgi:DNA-directed RNA polymerase specialized sigma24 family protein